MKEILIIDYGVGNIRSVMRGVEICGFQPKLSSKSHDIKTASKIILPGVGAFKDGMQGLYDRGLIEPIKEFILTGKFFLGICLGMQMMMTKSYEFGEHGGLNLIEGEVIPFKKNYKEKFKIPHVGWNRLKRPSNLSWDKTILENIKNENDLYFVHSFYVQPKYEKNCLSKCNYAALDFCAVVKKENVYGCQFHPEKSGETGLSILKSFCKK